MPVTAVPSPPKRPHFASSQKFDFIVLRLVIQHLNDLPGLFGKLRELLAPKGRILFIDSVDSMKLMSPRVLELEEMYSQLSALQKGKLGSRKAIEALDRVAEENGFTVDVVDKTPSAAISNEEKRRLLEMFVLGSEIVRRKFGVSIDQMKLLLQLIAWMGTEGSYGQVGLHRLVLRAKSRKKTSS